MSNCLNCSHPRHNGVCGAPVVEKTVIGPSRQEEVELVGPCICESGKPSPVRLRHAAEQARELDELLTVRSTERLTPLLIGFDLDYLASVFEQAAERVTDG